MVGEGDGDWPHLQGVAAEGAAFAGNFLVGPRKSRSGTERRGRHGGSAARLKDREQLSDLLSRRRDRLRTAAREIHQLSKIIHGSSGR